MISFRILNVTVTLVSFSVLFSTDVRALKFNDASFPFKLASPEARENSLFVRGSLKEGVIVYLLSLLSGVE